jgi:hypothetical protein
MFVGRRFRERFHDGTEYFTIRRGNAMRGKRNPNFGNPVWQGRMEIGRSSCHASWSMP